MSRVKVEFPSGGGGAPYALDVEDEGILVVSNPGAINFTGGGVTVTENPLGVAEVNIPIQPTYNVDIEDEGNIIVSNPSAINFTGGGVTVTENPLGVALVTIPTPVADYEAIFIDKTPTGSSGNVTGAKSYSLPANTYSNIEVSVMIMISQDNNNAMSARFTCRINGAAQGYSYFQQYTAVTAAANRYYTAQVIKWIFTRQAAATLTIDVSSVLNCTWDIANVTVIGIS